MQTLLDLIWEKRTDPESKIHFYEGFQHSESLRYAELWVYAQLWKKQIEAFDPEAKNRHVIISLPTGPEFLGAFFGSLMAGRIPVPVVSSEYLDKRDFAKFVDRLQTVLGPGILICQSEPKLSSFRYLKPVVFSRTFVEELCRQGLADETRPPATQTCLLQFSSGSTSEPKGVILSHQKILANLRQIALGSKATSADSLASWLPLFHDMGLIGGLLSPLYHGRPVYLHAPQDFVKEPLLWLEFVALKKVSVLVGPDFMYKLLSRRAAQIASHLDLSHIRICMTGSEPVIAGTLREFSEAFKKYGFRREAFMPVYGMAEAVLGVSFHQAGTLFSASFVDLEAYEKGQVLFVDKASEKSREIVSCGEPLEGIEIEIRGDNGQILAEKQIGEIYFRSPAQTEGYWNNPEASKALLVDGWIKTGDLGFLHQRQLYISGRKKDVIISRGRKIHAIDLEREVAAEFKLIRKIAVVALPEEQVAVAAELRTLRLQNKDQIKRRIHEKISRHVPLKLEQIYLLPARSLPVTSSGKLQRYKIQQLVRDGGIQKLSSHFVLRGFLAKIKENIFNFRFRDSSGWKVDAVKEELIFMFSQVAGIPREQVSLEKKLIDYGLDSLKMMELLTELEKKIGKIAIFDFYQLSNLQQVYDLYKKRMHENTSS